MRFQLHLKWQIVSLLLQVMVSNVALADTLPSQSSGISEKPVQQATIPFANHGGISNWKVVDDGALLIQDNHGSWYLAKLQNAPYDLVIAENLGFVTPPSGTLGQLSSIVVKGRRYPIISLTRTDPPAK